MNYDVCGIGNPLVDILIHVNENFIKDHNLNKGVMHLIDIKQKRDLLKSLQSYSSAITTEIGGSCPNTLTTLSKLGARVALAGKIGNDEHGKIFENKILQKNVASFLKKGNLDTGTSIILITPDGERTMNTYLGACQEFSPNDLSEDMIKKSNYFYFTGYMWDTDSQKLATRKAIDIAKDNDVKVVFDLADPFAVNRYRNDFLDLLKNDIDISLANAEEAKILTGLNPRDAAIEIGKFCNTTVIKNGEHETYIMNNGNLYTIESFSTDVVDTTGAGDNFAAGFIYGLIRGLPIENCGKIASFVALKCIEKVGAHAPDNILELAINKFDFLKIG